MTYLLSIPKHDDSIFSKKKYLENSEKNTDHTI